MYYFLVQAFKWVFDVDSKIITYKGFTFKVTAVFGHHVAIIHIAACLSRETVHSYSHTIRQA
jgi:tripartite-type tricarboxylate transporter receptor subunit TctC